ncbi:hypothetical protein CONLIGDRAFT_82700 [Coniochaeta ligniaria NRRL 30616]|uniref:Uncharacterized protein n=1 Tax=Coniochaeta ligniaria NRRL 30616 TaxID=1408157 RepID=A0A1J7IBS6_9PEZI|nr:hypothetical protein CONLIGDRAFT_82700 [Coniochaeta ligniaria NRRL 30616]
MRILVVPLNFAAIATGFKGTARMLHWMTTTTLSSSKTFILKDTQLWDPTHLFHLSQNLFLGYHAATAFYFCKHLQPYHHGRFDIAPFRILTLSGWSPPKTKTRMNDERLHDEKHFMMTLFFFYLFLHHPTIFNENS